MVVNVTFVDGCIIIMVKERELGYPIERKWNACLLILETDSPLVLYFNGLLTSLKGMKRDSNLIARHSVFLITTKYYVFPSLCPSLCLS